MLDWVLLLEVMGAWLGLSLLAALFVGRMIDIGVGEAEAKSARGAPPFPGGEHA